MSTKTFSFKLVTATQGAKACAIPVALTSSAVIAPIFLTRSGSLKQTRIHIKSNYKTPLFSVCKILYVYVTFHLRIYT